MIEKRQQAYLEAMNIPVWVVRHQPQALVEQPQVEQPQVEPPQAEPPQAEPLQLESLQVEVPTAGQVAEPVLREAVVDAQIAEAVAAEPAVPKKTVSQGLKLGPGSDGILLICARDSDSASKLANDIARVLPKNPVWGWPDSDDSALAPLAAVNENLFTCVAVFGDALAQLLFDKQVPAALGSATVIVLPAMSELESNSDARRKLWSELCRSGMILN